MGQCQSPITPPRITAKAPPPLQRSETNVTEPAAAAVVAHAASATTAAATTTAATTDATAHAEVTEEPEEPKEPDTERSKQRTKTTAQCSVFGALMWCFQWGDFTLPCWFDGWRAVLALQLHWLTLGGGDYKHPM